MVVIASRSFYFQKKIKNLKRGLKSIFSKKIGTLDIIDRDWFQDYELICLVPVLYSTRSNILSLHSSNMKTCEFLNCVVVDL